MDERNEKAKLIQNIYSLTSLQEGMLFHYLSAPDSYGYILQDCYYVNSSFREDLIGDALELLSMRHDAFRTSIVYEKVKEPVQVVYKNRPIEFSIENHSSLDEDEFEKKVKECLELDLARGFDLQKDTLVRFKFLKFNNSLMIIVSMHHIIVDGWCANMVIGGFLSLYNLLSQNVPKKDIQNEILKERESSSEFVDFVKWQLRQDKKKAMSYWEKLLDGYDTVAKIDPLTKSLPSDEQMRKKIITIGGDTGKRISRIVNEEKITYNIFAETLCGILLQQCINEKDVVFGKIVSGRNADINGIENVMGLFANTIPVRVVTEKGTTIRDLMRSLQKQSIESSSYDFCSLSEIQRITKQGTELINVLFAFENYSSGLEEKSNASDNKSDNYKISMSYTREQTEYAITITSFYTNNTLMFSILYDPNQFLSEEVDRLAERLEMISNEVAKDPDMFVDSIRIATISEEKLILNDFNATSTEYPRDKTVVELFEEQVKKTPDNIALIFEDKKLTYAELNARANSLAHKLREMGVKPDDFVAIIADRSIEMIAGIYGIIKAGGAYVPIDPTYPEDRINFIIEDCAPKAILKYTTESIELSTSVPVIDLSESEVWEGASENPEVVNKPEDLIYCIYTSGTTGQPKGSLIENKSVVRLVKNTNYIELDEHNVILQTGSMSFDASTLEVWGAFLNGGKLVISTQDVITDSVKLRALLEKEKVNTMWLTSTLFNQMISEENDIFDSLEHLLIGGEKLSDDHVRIMKSRNNGVKLTNGYGPTENTTFTTTYEIPADFEMIPIGKPIANTKIYIMNGNNLCGIGVPGELCTTGDGVARGYLNRPELTAEKFVKNPYGEGRMYRTGDLARWLPDGNIEYLGRIDEQVKIRGFRIELGEIESRIREIENIKDCAVIARADSTGDKAIYAYYTSDIDVAVSDIRDRLAGTLPEYMVPAYMMQIKAIPVTRNGKLDKRALPEIETKNTREYVAPRNEVEEAICQSFGIILKSDKIGVHDSFFELGGDSIKAIRIISKLREAGYSATVKDIMSGKNAEKIASLIKKNSDEQKYDQGEVTGYVVSTPIIRDFGEWVLAKPEHFNQAEMYQVDGIDNSVIRQAVESIVKHHDMLRAVYRNDSLEILPISESKLFDYYEYDFSNVSDKFKAVEDKCTEIQKSFSLENGPLVKIAVFELGAKKRMMFCIHHLAVDGVSWRIIGEDFETAVGQLKAGEEVQLPDKTVSFKQWAEYIDGSINNNEITIDKPYWENIINNINNRTGFDPTNDYNIGMTGVMFDKEFTSKLINKTFNAYKTEINDVLLSALTKAYSLWRNCESLAVGLESHGREFLNGSVKNDRTVGWFTSMYPVLLYNSNNIEELIIGTKETLHTIPNEGISYGILCRKMPDNIDIYFNYLGQFEGNSDDINEEVFSTGISIDPGNRIGGNINFNGAVSSGILGFTVTYNTLLIDPDDMERFMTLFHDALTEIVDFCSGSTEEKTTISDLTDEELDDDIMGMLNDFYDI